MDEATNLTNDPGTQPEHASEVVDAQASTTGATEGEPNGTEGQSPQPGSDGGAEVGAAPQGAPAGHRGESTPESASFEDFDSAHQRGTGDTAAATEASSSDDPANAQTYFDDDMTMDLSDALNPLRSDSSRSVDEILAQLRASDTAAGGDDYGAPERDVVAEAEAVLDGAARTAQLEHLVVERTEDLQRLQAEYSNYRKRVERDRKVARQQGADSVVRELLPILDAIDQAASHEELTGGFKVVAGEFTRVTDKLGVTPFGAVGDEFDPNLHEALMQLPADNVEPGHVAQIIQRGYMLGETVLRPARVAVAAE